jgi:hypothetical protein
MLRPRKPRTSTALSSSLVNKKMSRVILKIVLRKAGKALLATNRRGAAFKEGYQRLLHEVEAIRPPMP